jgi:acyl carrier protein
MNDEARRGPRRDDGRELGLEAIEARIATVARAALALGETPLDPALGATLDSVQRLTLVVAVEDDFGVALDPTRDAEIQTLHDLAGAIQEGLRGGAHARA